MNRLIVLAGIAAVGGAAWLGIDKSSKPPPVPQAPPPVPVVTAQVGQGDFPVLLGGIGTVQALNSAVIRSQVTGMLQSVNFTQGQRVKAGDLLAQIDPRPEQAVLAQAQAQLARDEAHLDNARTNLARYVPLLSKGFATDQQVTDQRSQISQLQSSARSDEAAILNAQTQLSYTSLVAPFDGVTGVNALDVGNVIHPTDMNGLVTVNQVQPIYVLFTLPSADIPRVQTALDAGPVAATAYDQAGNRKLDDGSLLLINNQADPNSGTVQLKAQFPNPNRLLWPGTFVNVELTLRTVRNALTVPTDAVQQGADGSFVYVVGSGGKVVLTHIQVGERTRGTALVTEGVQAGQTVVEQGQYRLTDGVVVVASQPANVASASPATSGLLP